MLSRVLGSSFGITANLAMQGEFSLLVVATTIACMNEFQRVLTMSGRGLFKCCIILVVEQDGMHKLMIKKSSFLYNSNTTSSLVVSSYGVLSPSIIWYSSESIAHTDAHLY